MPYVEKLSGSARSVVITLLGIPGRLHRIVRVSAMAAECPDVADRRSFSEWCAAEVVRQLPRRNHPSPPRDNTSPSHSDAGVRSEYAQCLWRIHGADAPARYVQEVLDTLDLNGVNAPLYRSRDYQGWSAHLDGLLWGLRLGLSVVEQATDQRTAALTYLLPRLCARLHEFRPGLWHHFLDSDGSLADLVDSLSRWTDDAAATQNDLDALDEAFARPEVPGIWRLRAALASQRLAERHLAHLMDWSASPSSSPSMCSLTRRNPSMRSIGQHLDALRMAFPQNVAQFETWFKPR